MGTNHRYSISGWLSGFAFTKRGSDHSALAAEANIHEEPGAGKPDPRICAALSGNWKAYRDQLVIAKPYGKNQETDQTWIPEPGRVTTCPFHGRSPSSSTLPTADQFALVKSNKADGDGVEDPEAHTEQP